MKLISPTILMPGDITTLGEVSHVVATRKNIRVTVFFTNGTRKSFTMRDRVELISDEHGKVYSR